MSGDAEYQVPLNKPVKARPLFPLKDTIMPTGYTYTLLRKKQTFAEFALSCSRNFGALIAMRDDSADAVIPERFEPSDYHLKALSELKGKITRFKKMTPKERRAFGAKERNRRINTAASALKSIRRQNEVFGAMRNEALAWRPPTEEHNGLHKFIVQQLESSMEDDVWNINRLAEAVLETPMSVYQDTLKSLLESVDYHTRQHAEEIERTDKRNAWLKALRDSLPE